MMPPGTDPADGGAASRHGDQALFYGLRFLSQLAQGLYLAAILLLVGTSSIGPLGLSSIFAATLLAAVVCGLPGGALADRLGPGRGLLVGAGLRLAAVAGAVALRDAPSRLWLAAAGYSAGSQVYSAAEMALILVVRRGTLPQAHGHLMALQYGGQAAAALALAPLLVLGGPRLALAAALPLAAAMVLVTAALARRHSHPARWTRPPYRLAFRETYRYFRAEPRAVYAVALLAFTDMAIRSALVAVPRYLAHDLGLNRGAVATAIGLGAVAAGIGMVGMVRSLSFPAAARVMRLTLAGSIAAITLLVVAGPLLALWAGNQQVDLLADLGGSVVTRFAVVALVAVMLGLCLGTAPVSARTVLSATAPPARQGRVFATQATFAHAAVIPPLLLSGWGTQHAGPWPTLALIGSLGLGLLVVLEAAERRRGRGVPAGRAMSA